MNEQQETQTFFEDNRQVAVDYIHHMKEFLGRMREKGWAGEIAFSAETLDDETWMEGIYDDNDGELIDPTKTFNRGEELITEEQNRLARLYGYTYAAVRDGLIYLIRMTETNQSIEAFMTEEEFNGLFI